MLTMSVNKVYLLSYNAYESSGLFWRLMPDSKPLRKNFPATPLNRNYGMSQIHTLGH